jgi:hypothetical protein
MWFRWIAKKRIFSGWYGGQRNIVHSRMV